MVVSSTCIIVATITPTVTTSRRPGAIGAVSTALIATGRARRESTPPSTSPGGGCLPGSPDGAYRDGRIPPSFAAERLGIAGGGHPENLGAIRPQDVTADDRVIERVGEFR